MSKNYRSKSFLDLSVYSFWCGAESDCRLVVPIALAGAMPLSALCPQCFRTNSIL
ncbi:MAG: hypothetical protein ACI309_05325 [Candidatus Limisoma sp.]|nr:hypothetical protein [Bacteroidales bacterium]MDD6669000.1 hypothetical protein [Bacteroidales bacterium]